MITTLPEHMKPMVEKAAEASYAWVCSRYQYDPTIVSWQKLSDARKNDFLASSEGCILAFLNACLEGGLAREGAARVIAGDWITDTNKSAFEGGLDFPALILSLGKAK
jgi:N-acetylneuraminic acid mutarotase